MHLMTTSLKYNNLYTTSPNDEEYIDYVCRILQGKYIKTNKLIKKQFGGYSNTSKFKMPKIDFKKYKDIKLFDLGVYVYINYLVNRTTKRTNWIDNTDKKLLLQSIRGMLKKNKNKPLRVSKRLEYSISRMTDYGLLEFTDKKEIKIPFKTYVYIYHLDIYRITQTMLETGYKHIKYFEALGTYMLMCSTNFSENTIRFNGNANGIVIAPRSVKAWSAARINTVWSLPSRKNISDTDEVKEYSNQVIDNALDWLEEHNLVATVHIYDYHPKFKDFRETTYYTPFRNLEGLYDFFSSYAHSEYNKHMKLDEVDVWKNNREVEAKRVITEEYCQQMNDIIQTI